MLLARGTHRYTSSLSPSALTTSAASRRSTLSAMAAPAASPPGSSADSMAGRVCGGWAQSSRPTHTDWCALSPLRLTFLRACTRVPRRGGQPIYWAGLPNLFGVATCPPAICNAYQSERCLIDVGDQYRPCACQGRGDADRTHARTEFQHSSPLNEPRVTPQPACEYHCSWPHLALNL